MVSGSNHDTLKNNSVSANHSSGILVTNNISDSSFINILSNTIENNVTQGIQMAHTHNSTMSGNHVNSNDEDGINVDISTDNTVYKNEFIDNHKNAVVTNSTNMFFNVLAPDGGNRWSDYDSRSEGCSDANSGGPDGFCDAGYIINSADHVVDNLPVAVVETQGTAGDQNGTAGSTSSNQAATNGTTGTTATLTTSPSSLTTANQTTAGTTSLPKTGMMMIIPATGLMAGLSGVLLLRRRRV